METSLCTMIDVVSTDEGTLGIMNIPGTSYFPKMGKCIIGTLQIEINIEERAVKNVEFVADGNHGLKLKLTNQEGLCFAWQTLVGCIHPVIHGYANFSTSLMKTSKFFTFMSMVTLKYNTYGSNFGKFMEILRWFGISTTGKQVMKHFTLKVQGGQNVPALFSDGYFSSEISRLFLIQYKIPENKKKVFRSVFW